MQVSVKMPRIEEGVTEGTVTRWLKNEGDQVEAGEPMLEVSTDRLDVEIVAPVSGVLSSIKVGEDETVDVGAELATIGDGKDASAGHGLGSAQQAQSEPAKEQAKQQERPFTPDGVDLQQSAAKAASTRRRSIRRGASAVSR